MTDEHSQQVEWAGSAVAEDEVAVLRARLAAAERRAEAAERRARQLDGVFGALADGIIVYDRQGNLLFTNPANRAILGSPEQWETYFAQPLAERLKLLEMRDLAGHPLPREQWPHLRVLRGEALVGATAVELSAIGLDGQPRQLSVTGAPLRDEHGEIVGAVLIHRDVSERRQLERETRRQATMLERAHDAIFMWELGGPIVYWNRGAELLYGFTRAEAIGRVSHDLLHTRLPQPPAEFEAALATAGEWTGELTHTTRDGREVVVLSRHQVLIEPDGHRYVLETARDVTERGRLERRTHEALDALLKMAETLVQAPEGDSAESSAEMEQDLQAVARRMAELTCSVLGCRRVSISAIEPETQRVQTVALVGFTPEQERQWMEDQQRRQARFGESSDLELLARFRSGEVLALDLTQPPYNERPNPFGITTSLFAPMRIGERIAGIVTMDYGGPPHTFTSQEIALAGAIGKLAAFVVERERLLRERAEAQARALALEDANRRMDEFLSIASHELRTPLTTVKANLQLARRRLARGLGEGARAGGVPGTPGTPGTPSAHLEAVRGLLDRAATSSDRQERLVNDLLDVSRIRSGKLELRAEPCDVAAIVREAVDEQRLGHPNRRITLAAPKGRVDAVADADRIAQVITNLLTNALKYSDSEQPVDVRLSVEPGDADAGADTEGGRVARVSIHDRGPGIAPEEQAHVWDMFHRVPGIEVRSGSGVGLGLGLHISKTLVERHGGQVGVESTPGEGATFWFTLPLLPLLPLAAGGRF